MIGIDIIDRSDPKLRLKRESTLRFIKHKSDDYTALTVDINTLWYSVWCAKEAIFKVKRIHQPFDPHAIKLRFTVNAEAIYFTSDDIVGQLWISPRKLVSIAYYEGQAPHWHSFTIQCRNHQQCVREQLHQYCLSHSLQDYTLAPARLPILEHSISNQKIFVSFSHHYQLGAFALIKPFS
ncbi:MAG: hypothetical protein ACPGJS_10355 [Flammeovirgaceae bacterium]